MPDRSPGPGAARPFARKRFWTKRLGDAGERDARRLGLAGIQVPRNADGTPAALVEISPRCVVDDADAVEYFRANPVAEPIQPGQSRAFGK